MEFLEKLLVTSMSLASEIVASQRLQFEIQLDLSMTLKRKARLEVVKGVFPRALTIPLVESEIFSENLFTKDVYLKVNETAEGSLGVLG